MLEQAERNQAGFDKITTRRSPGMAGYGEVIYYSLQVAAIKPV